MDPCQSSRWCRLPDNTAKGKGKRNAWPSCGCSLDGFCKRVSFASVATKGRSQVARRLFHREASCHPVLTGSWTVETCRLMNVLVAFLTLWQNTWERQLKGDRLMPSHGFRRFSPRSLGSGCLGRTYVCPEGSLCPGRTVPWVTK